MKPLYQRILRNLMQPTDFLSWGLYQLFRSNNYFFVSMPCSGTHWLRFMIAKALTDHFNLDYEFHDIEAREIVPSFRVKTDRFKYNDRPEIPRLQHSHDYFSPFYWNARVLLLLRDLKDSLASHYERYAGWHDDPVSFSDYLRENGLDLTEVQSLSWRLRFLNSWGSNRERTSEFLLVKYEDIKADPHEELGRVLDFLELKNVRKDLIDRAVEFASRENMRKLEEKSQELEGKTPKVNKAETERHEPYFNEEDLQYFNESLRKNLQYDFGYDYKPLASSSS